MSFSWLKVSMSTQNIASRLWYLIGAIGQCLVHRLAQIAQSTRRALTFSSSSSKLSAVKQGFNTIEEGSDSSKHLSHYQDSPAAEPGSLQSTVLESQTSTLFAVLIGINKYKDPKIPDLCGAVGDADAIENFLISEVGVMKDRIVNIRDEEATREAIVKALRDLAQSSAIHAQDPIFIYYAGHGSECPSPINGWKTNAANGMMKMLLPHDFNLQGSNDVQGQGIFDNALSQIFADIAMAKSDNITVILDCCYSGYGAKQNPSDGAPTIRGIQLPHDYIIPTCLIPGPCIGLSALETYKESMSSHVLLTACVPGQPALESQGHGVFTWEFLNLLKQEGNQRLTCADVIKLLPCIPSQNPQCEGVNKGRRLFDRVNRPVTMYRVHSTSGKPNEFTLEAGKEHGIVNGTKFNLYSDEILSTSLGSIVAFDTAPFTTQCLAVDGVSYTLSQSAYAVQTRVEKGQDLCLFIHPDDPCRGHLTQLLKEIQDKSTERTIRLAKHDYEEPDLVISTRDEVVQFEIGDRICRQYGLTHMPFREVRASETEYLRSILLSAADFYWHLHHPSKDSLTSMVDVECFKLEGTGQLTDDLNEIFVPEFSGRNLNIEGTIFIDIGDEGEPYGYKITSKSDVPLYVALFYFDASDLSIVDYYLPEGLPSTNDQPDFSLLPKGSLSIGIGDNGDPPRTYYLREGQSVDVGFLKLYVSTEYVDYSRIIQQSPFQSIDTWINGTSSIHSEVWNTLTIPIIQQRRLHWK